MTTPTFKVCRRCNTAKAALEFTKNASNPDGLANWCRECIRTAREARSQATAPHDPRVSTSAETLRAAVAASEAARPQTFYRYIAPTGLLELFETNQACVAAGELPEDLYFLGPSGSGKTEGAKFLADAAGMPFVKVDAPAMTDPESWFGTREVIEENGTSVTAYKPSTFIEWVQKRCVMLVDEANRIQPQNVNIVLALMDGTRQITNPLTGEIVKRHPECYIILSGNRGLRFVGTYAIEPALLTRVLTVPFDYLPADQETGLVVERTGVTERVAATLVRFAGEVRKRATQDDEWSPISTREVLRAAKLIARGASPDLAVQASMIWQASDEGGSESLQTKLRQIWIGLRPLLDANTEIPY